LYNKGYEYIKWINPLMNSEPSWSSHLLKTPPLNTASLGPNLQHTNFGEDIKIQWFRIYHSITLVLIFYCELSYTRREAECKASIFLMLTRVERCGSRPS
jgi:hypothetical protein